MNTALAKTPVQPTLVSGGAIRPIIPQTFEEAWRIALAISKAGMAPPGLETPEKITIALMAGLETGLPPMQAIQSIAVINNRPSLYGDGPIAIVRASGLLESIEEKFDGEGDATIAVCSVKRRGEPHKITRVFSVADAKRAGLWGKKGPWDFYPTRMLAVRARAFALRDGFADVLRGLAIAEEQADIVKPAVPQPGPPPDDEIPEFAAGVTPVSPAADTAATSPDGPHGGGGGSDTPVAAADLTEAIDKLLALAADPDTTPQDKLQALDELQPAYVDAYDKPFVAAAFPTIVKVIKGELKPAAARKYMASL